MTSSLLRLVVALILTLALTTFLTGTANAQPSLDPSFSASLSREREGDVRGVFPQADGKIFVVGAFKVAAGKARSSIVRLNADGTVDPTFDGPDFRAYEPFNPARILDIDMQSTGKILVGGEFLEADGQAKYRLVRLNANGSLDTSFPSQPLSWVVQEILVLPDDKIIIGGGFDYITQTGNRKRLVQLNADGTLDTSVTFSPEPDNNVAQVVRQSDGKLVVAYGNKIVRYTATGALDGSFNSLTAGSNTFFSAMKQQADGRIVVGGNFTTINGFGVLRLFRMSADGVIDASFAGTSPNGDVVSIAIAADQRIVIAGGFTFYGASARKGAALLDADGNLITSYNPSTNPLRSVFSVGILADGRILLGGQGDPTFTTATPPLVATDADGAIDSMFNPMIGMNGIAGRVVIQPDGKILVGGQFRNADGLTRYSVARLNIDGSIDSAFTPPGPPDSAAVALETLITGLDVQADGKVLVVGTNGQISRTAIRLQPNGLFERSLSSDLRPRDVKVLSNQQILLAVSNAVRRYNSDGTFDISIPVTGDVYRIAVQPDGKILIGGSFTQVQATTRNGIARLNSDGTLDTSFNPVGGAAGGPITDIALQSDGKVIVAGQFTGLNFDTNRKYLARLNSDGSLDTGYAPVVDAPITAVKLQSDGRLLIGGDMTTVNGTSRPRFARLNSNGSLEPTFNVSVNDTVLTIELQPDGKIVYGGRFTKTNGVSTPGVGRLLNPAVIPPTVPFDFDGDGKADISVFRPSTSRWYEALSSGPTIEETFGTTGDIIVPADFDGDGKTDEAIFRPSNGQWWYKSSIDGSQVVNPFGQSGDIPRPSDFDGDGRADLVLFRPSNSTWYRFGSTLGNVPSEQFGLPGDQPLVGDFDGDGKSDLAVFRPSTGDWWYAASSAGGAFRQTHWGQNGDIPVPADYDGDSKTDFAIFRPSDGGWYIYNSGNGSFTILAFGTNGDRPVAADYDGDGRADIAVFRPSTGIWYLYRTTAGFAGYQFGISTDVAIPGALIP